MVCNPTLFLCYKKRLNSHLSTKIKPTKKAWHNYIDHRSTNYTMLLFNIINRAASPQIITCSGKLSNKATNDKTLQQCQQARPHQNHLA